MVSCSWGADAKYYPLSTRKAQAISRCATEGRNQLGCVISFAAGNENRDINNPNDNSVNDFPIPSDVIAVAESKNRDQESS